MTFPPRRIEKTLIGVKGIRLVIAAWKGFGAIRYGVFRAIIRLSGQEMSRPRLSPPQLL